MEMPSYAPVRVPDLRWIYLVSCATGVLFSLQVFAIGLFAPVFDAMFADFGSKMPGITTFVISTRYLWLVFGVGGVVVAIKLYLQGKAGSMNAFRLGGLFALFTFLVAQALLVVLFLPIFQMSRVMGNG